MKHSNKRIKHTLSKRQIKSVNKLALMAIILIFAISLILHFKLNLFFVDRYDWYMYMSFKHTGIDSEKSIEYANKAIDTYPIRPEAHYRRIRIFTGLEKYNQVETELENFKNRFPDYVPYYYWRMGWIRLNQDRADEAKRYFEDGILSLKGQKDIFLSFYYVGLGIIELNEDNFEKAMDYFNESLLYANYTDQTLYRIRESYNVEEIVDYNQNFIRGSTHAGMGFAYQYMELNEKAKKEFEMAEKYWESSVEYISRLVS